jgi:aldehyde dehydrogenase (NAD+)
MKKEHRFYINGEWIDSSSTELIEIENPSTEEVIGTISAGTKEDIDHAVAAAKKRISILWIYIKGR